MDRTQVLNALHIYLIKTFQLLNADEIREAAECGLTMAEDIAKETIEERK